MRPGIDEVLIEIFAAGVNRADLLQAAGNYPPPPGASDILGLEVSGRIAAVGDGVSEWIVGQEVCALLAGGGYAESVIVPAAQVLPVPPGVGEPGAPSPPPADGVAEGEAFAPGVSPAQRVASAAAHWPTGEGAGGLKHVRPVFQAAAAGRRFSMLLPMKLSTVSPRWFSAL